MAGVTGYGTFAPRVDRIAAVRQFIAEAGFSEALRGRHAPATPRRAATIGWCSATSTRS